MQVIRPLENVWKKAENLVTLYYLKETMAVRRPAWNEGKRELTKLFTQHKN
jgi:hypothetical protein